MNELGSGSYGKVYRDKVNGKTVAIKSYTNLPSHVEIDIMSTYKHPNVMGLISIVRDTKPKIVMDLGGEIVHLNESVVSDLVQGLAFLHSRGVLHCDIKANNCLTVEGKHKWIDFGSACISSPEQAAEGYLVEKDKYVSPFIAPELCEEYMQTNLTRVSTKTDIFALGWCLLCIADNKLNIPNKKQQLKIKQLIKNPSNEHIDESYYYHYLHTRDPEKRMKVIQKATKGSVSKQTELLIHSFLSWNPEERPSLSVEIPGKVELYVPRIENPGFPDIRAMENIDEDVIFFFMSLDVYYRTGYRFFDIFIFILYEYGREKRSQVFKMKDLVYDLRGNIGSCNLLYRISNSIECLAAMVEMMRTFKGAYSDIDFFDLKYKNEQVYKEGSKSISCKDFHQLFYQPTK